MTEKMPRGNSDKPSPRPKVTCPNCKVRCVILQKPAWVLIDLHLLEHLPENLKDNIEVCTLIDAVCPKCGFIMSRGLNRKEWTAFLEGQKVGAMAQASETNIARMKIDM